MRNRKGQRGKVEGQSCLPVRPPPPPRWNPVPFLDCTPDEGLQHLEAQLSSSLSPPFSEEGKLRQPLPMCAEPPPGGESVTLKQPR